MTHESKHKLKVALTTALVVGATAVAGNVSVPNSFTAGTPARAAEVNANFAAVKVAVDDNHGRLQALEGSVPTIQSNVTSLQGSVSTLQGTVGTMQTTVGSLQTTVAGLNTSVNTLNTTTWRRTGNTGTNPLTDYVGTADNTPLDLRVDATSVMRLWLDQVSVNSAATPPTGVEFSVFGGFDYGEYANLFLQQRGANVGGFMLSVGDAVPTGQPLSTLGRASFFLDATQPSGPQLRRLRIDDLGRTAINRDDTFVQGVGNVALAVGRDGVTGNGAYLTPGGVWTNASSRQFKHAVQAINTASVLEKVVALPITTWEYRDSSEGRHLGPMAEDFATAFKLGKDTQHIATVDEMGVALGAIQGLNAKLERENAELRRALQALDARLKKLE